MVPKDEICGGYEWNHEKENCDIYKKAFLFNNT